MATLNHQVLRKGTSFQLPGVAAAGARWMSERTEVEAVHRCWCREPRCPRAGVVWWQMRVGGGVKVAKEKRVVS